MMMDIFSSFDDHNKVFLDCFVLLWIIVGVMVLFCCQKLWLNNGSVNALYSLFLWVVEGLYGRTHSKMVGGMGSLFSVLFIMLIIMNLLGLNPYVFSLTSHLAVNFSVSLPIWVSVVMMSVFYDMPVFLAHLQPLGSPALLNPFLCLIELVSNMVRPVTLAVRLTANLSTGHILMSLLGVGFTGSSIFLGFVILLIGSFYFIFEMGVCMVQSYIFTLLPTLYMDEHPMS